MAEKQYKNYDERFLKEDTSSSEPVVIEGTNTDGDTDDGIVIIKNWPDGTPIKTVEDLYKVFLSGAKIRYSYSGADNTGITLVETITPTCFAQGNAGGTASNTTILFGWGYGHMTMITTEELYQQIMQ